MKTTNELKTQATERSQAIHSIHSIGHYRSLIRAMYDNSYELVRSLDVIDEDHPQAEGMKQTIKDLASLNMILLEGFEKHSKILEDMVDEISLDLSR